VTPGVPREHFSRRRARKKERKKKRERERERGAEKKKNPHWKLEFRLARESYRNLPTDDQDPCPSFHYCRFHLTKGRYDQHAMVSTVMVARYVPAPMI